MMSEQKILEVNNLKKMYQKNTVLQKINLSLKTHDVYALVGANGTGKTTLLSILAGLVCSDGGSININKKGNKGNPTSIAFQPTSLYPFLSGKDNLALLFPQPSKAKCPCHRRNTFHYSH